MLEHGAAVLVARIPKTLRVGIKLNEVRDTLVNLCELLWHVSPVGSLDNLLRVCPEILERMPVSPLGVLARQQLAIDENIFEPKLKIVPKQKENREHEAVSVACRPVRIVEKP
jgi:hypothetical protein